MAMRPKSLAPEGNGAVEVGCGASFTVGALSGVPTLVEDSVAEEDKGAVAATSGGKATPQARQ
jgi:hypothetical protein